MSNHSEKLTDDVSSETNAPSLEVEVGSSPEQVEADAPVAEQTSHPVEDSGSRQGVVRPSDDLLIRAVRSLVGRGASPFAAGVYGSMRQFDPEFTFANEGYLTFRAFLNDAVSRGVVTISPAPRGNDVIVDEVATQSMYAPQTNGGLNALSPDLWDAFVNWNAREQQLFDRKSGTLVQLSDSGSLGADVVPVPSADRSDQLAWMREFAALETDQEARDALEKGLQDEEPTRGFSQELRDRPAPARRWKRFLRSKILQRASEWASQNGIDYALLAPTPQTARTVVNTPAEAQHIGDAATRERILAVLAELPLHELLALRIPIEYALRR